jgi:hypothetical protein
LSFRGFEFLKTLSQAKGIADRTRLRSRLFLKPEHLLVWRGEKLRFGLVYQKDLVYYLSVEMMGTDANEGLDQRAVADVWRHTLSQIPSVFGRLVYLAGLRNPNSARYEHHGLALVFGTEHATRALKKSHKQVFTEWLSFNLEQQLADLNLYLSDLPEEKKTVLQAWTKLKPYKNVLPSSAKAVERRLYLKEMETMIELLKGACGADEPGPDS